MQIERLPSGNYRIRMTENGKRISMTVPYKPKPDEAYKLITDKINNPTGKYDTLTLKEACDKYVESKNNSLSPSTIRGYKCIIKNLPDAYMSIMLKDLDDITVQEMINAYAKDKSPKTVRNANGFIVGVIKAFLPSKEIHTTLPQKVVKDAYIPTEEDVKKLLEYAKDSEYYVALTLACLSLRRSEICALTIDDLADDNTITINKALVPDENEKYVIKPNPKNDSSNRTIIVPDDVADRIREQGYVYKYVPNAIDKYLRNTLPKLGIPVFSIHKLRHFFASYTHEKGYSDAVIQQLGGWSTDHIMKTVYRHAMKKEEAKVNVTKDLGSLF